MRFGVGVLPNARHLPRDFQTRFAARNLKSGGDPLRAMRLRNGLSLEALAAQTAVATRTLRRWEQGETWPDLTHLYALCRTLNAHDSKSMGPSAT